MNIGFALSGSFCTFNKIFPVIEELSRQHNLLPIISNATACIDNRFATVEQTTKRLQELCGSAPLCTIAEVEPIGPKKLTDAMVIAPCSGNTLAKLAHSIADGPVTMAAKSHLRNGRPLILAISTNDALAGAAENIGKLMARKNIYFVPFRQDDPINKPTSIVADFSKIPAAIESAARGVQLQPILI